MIKKAIAFGVILGVIAGTVLASTGTAEARYWYHHGGGGWGWGWGGGAAVGLLGGALIGSAIASQPRYYDYDDGPVYYGAPPPYPSHCYVRRERIANRYDSGSHLENVRVCS
jgi:hypothetical protein